MKVSPFNAKLLGKLSLRNSICSSHDDAFESLALNQREVGIGGVDIVEAHEVVPEALVGDELQIEVLGVLEGENGRVCRGVSVVLGVEFESGDGTKAVP